MLRNLSICNNHNDFLNIIHYFGFFEKPGSGVQKMAKFFFLGFEVMCGRFGRFDLNGNPFDDLQTRSFESS